MSYDHFALSPLKCPLTALTKYTGIILLTGQSSILATPMITARKGTRSAITIRQVPAELWFVEVSTESSFVKI